jgi:ribosomal protein L18E
MRFQFDEKVKELNEKNARLLAQNSRYKTENERLDKLYQATKNENVKLNEQIDNLIKNTKRKEGNTWKEINRIVEHATKPAANNVSQICDKIGHKNGKDCVKVRVSKLTTFKVHFQRVNFIFIFTTF